MISQEQAVVTSSVVTVLGGYVLWSLLQNGAFLPYVEKGTPNATNILEFLGLLSVVIGGIGAIGWVIYENIMHRIFKKPGEVSGAAVLALEVTMTLFIFVTLLLHVFRIIHFQWVLLSCLVIWGIVGYGKFKERNRFQRYIAPGHRAGKGESQDTI